MTVSVKKMKLGDGELSSAQIVGYLVDAQATGDYYTEDSKAYMRWFVNERVAELFALKGTFSRVDLKYFIEGRDPVTGQELRKAGADKSKVAAVDLTVSPAPKSVSILWALADPGLRFDVELMVHTAVDHGVRRLLDDHPLIRVTENGRTQPAIARDYVVAQAHHTTARLTKNARGVPDPQLHVHNLLIGAVDDRGKLRAIESRYVMDAQAAVDAEATAALAAMLQEAGFELELGEIERRPGTGQPRRVWEVKGIPESLIREMSSRTAEIEDLKRQYTEATGREAVGAGWDAFVTSHRSAKARFAAPELRAEWQFESAAHGLTPADVAAIRARAHARREAAGPLGTEAGRRAAKREKWRGSPEATEFRRLMLEWICKDHAFIPYGEMDRLGHQLAVGLLSPREADGVTAEMIGDGDLVVTTDRMVTTLEILSYEQRVKAAVAELLAAEPGSAVAEELIEAELRRREEDGAPFDEGQAEALRLAVSGARFVSITGKAGRGKGHATAAMTELWHATGRRVTALAVAGRTAQQAGADSGANEAMTVDKLRVLMAEEADRVSGAIRSGALRLDSRDVLLVDEAGMLDHQRYAPLVEAAVSSGATLVQVGDDAQLSPVGPGGLWTVTHRQAAAARKAVELKKIHRAKNPREAQAWEDLEAGRVEAALTWILEQDRIRIYETRPEMLAGMVEAWWNGDRDGLMVTDTSNAERDQLNELAQAKRLEAGELEAEAVELSSGRKLRAGDRVLFNAIYKPGVRGMRRVENGTPAVVLAVHVEAGTVELELSEPRRRQPRRMVLGADAPLELAYARHVVKAQGVTVNDTDLAVSRHTAHNELYVMYTRARNGARVHAIAAELAEGLDVGPDQLRGERPFVAEPAPGAEDDSDVAANVDAQESPAATPMEPPWWGDLARSGAEPERAPDLREDPRRWQATVEQVSRRAGRSHTKEAVGDRESSAPLPEQDGRHEEEEDRFGVNVGDRAQRADANERQAAGNYPLQTLPLPQREPDLPTLVFDDGVQVERGQVVRFSDPGWLAGRAGDEIQPDDLGVILGCHRGGITFDYATVELVGGRQVEVWRTALGITVEPELEPAAVRDAIPRPDQRDPTSLNVLELHNGVRLMAGDRVRFARPAAFTGAGPVAEGAVGVVHTVERHRHNRAIVALADGRQAHVYPLAELAIVHPATPVACAPAPLPAYDLAESAGRAHIESRELTNALAYYRLLGRLHEAEDPVSLAAELLQRDPWAVVVVSGADDERRVRAALAEPSQLMNVSRPSTPIEARSVAVDPEASATPDPSQIGDQVRAEADQRSPTGQTAAQPAAGRSSNDRPDGRTDVEAIAGTMTASPAIVDPHRVPDQVHAEDPWAGRIIQAAAAYDVRRARREAWAASDRDAERAVNLVEPGAVPRAYVLAPELIASDDLIRGVSVAGESHLLTPPLRPAMAGTVEAQAADIRNAMQRRDQERAAAAAGRAEQTVKRHVEAQAAEAQREGSRAVER